MKLKLPTIKTYQKNPQSGITGIIYLIAIIAAIVGLILYSDVSKVGDDFYFVEEGVEGFQLSLSAITPDERFEMEARLAHERLLEAKELDQLPGRREDFELAIKKYQNMLKFSYDSLEVSFSRGFDVRNFLPSYIDLLLKNLSILASIYREDIDDYNFLDAPIRATLKTYNQSIERLEKTQGEAAVLDFRSRLFDVQDELRAKGAPTTP